MQKMSQLVIGTSVLVGALLGLSGTAHASVQQDFINQNKIAVQQVTQKYGLYASVQMAQAALESGWGQSELSTKGNNFFGIKQLDVSQPTYWGNTLEYEKGQWISVKAPFVKYASKQASLEDNAKLLKYGLTWNSKFYAGTWKVNAKTYQDAANSLTGKYATDPQYGAKLINVIKTYKLYTLDNNITNQTGYLQDSDGRYYWFEKGQKYTGIRKYMGAYYYFKQGVRQENQWVTQWGQKYYVGRDGRTVQGVDTVINGQHYNFGNNGTFYMRYKYQGYMNAGNGYKWYEDGRYYTGIRNYMGAYYYFNNGNRQHNQWVNQWGNKYYVGSDGRTVEGRDVVINGLHYDFGTNHTFNLIKLHQGYDYDGSNKNGGYRWYEKGKLYTGFRFYMGTYYWFVDGVRQNEGWRHAWGYTYYTNKDGRAVQGHYKINGKSYYFGDNGTYYMR